MNDLAERITFWRVRKGFKTPSCIIGEQAANETLSKLMLVVTELAEAAEAVRHGDEANFREEVADTFIRLLDLTGAMGIDIEMEIEQKMLVNEGRPVRHGKVV